MVFSEMPAFLKAIQGVFNDEDIRALQNYLLTNPEAGAVIQGRWRSQITMGSDEQRKKRWCKNHLLLCQETTMDLFLVCLPQEHANQPHARRKEVICQTCQGVIMTERDRVVQGILEGLQEAVAYSKGETIAARVTVLEVEDALNARKALKLSQAKFADLIGVPKRTVEGWEQGRTKPSGAARSLLKIATRNPEAVLQALK